MRRDVVLTVLQPDEGVGLERFASWMGLETRVINLWEDTLPAADDVEHGLLVLGGRMDALDETKPWQLPTRALVSEVARRGIPVLGICLGHQILGRALGGEVTVADPAGGEHGSAHLEWAPEALDDPVLGPAARLPVRTVAMSHGDVVSRLPQEAVELATTTKYGHQAFRVGNAVGVQFHPEASPERMAAWAERRGDDGEAMRREMEAVDAEVATVGEAIARAFADVVRRFAAA